MTEEVTAAEIEVADSVATEAADSAAEI